jgi:hypothetical protein
MALQKTGKAAAKGAGSMPKNNLTRDIIRGADGQVPLGNNQSAWPSSVTTDRIPNMTGLDIRPGGQDDPVLAELKAAGANSQTRLVATPPIRQ